MPYLPVTVYDTLQLPKGDLDATQTQIVIESKAVSPAHGFELYIYVG